MNANELEGSWKQIKGRVKEEWGRITDDDLDQIEGRMTALVGKIQERYGKTLDEASREVDRWLEGEEADA